MMERIMAVFLVVLIPVLLMLFALFMERVENRLKTRTVSEADVEQFLSQARPEEVNTLMREGWTRAFDKFRQRRRPRFRRRGAGRAKASSATSSPQAPGPAQQAAADTPPPATPNEGAPRTD